MQCISPALWPTLITSAEEIKLPVPYIGDLMNYGGDSSGNAKKTIGLMRKTTTLHLHHAFLYISLPPLHNYDMKWPNLNDVHLRTGTVRL